ncbi:ShlB/FhaC/HecB family hemolysin secretion/activation protein, partial [Xanthobacter oligotrophicus]
MTRSRISAGASRPDAMRVSGLALAAAVGLLVPASALAQGLPFNIGDAVRDAQQSQQAAPQPQQAAPLVLPRLAEP